MERLTADPADIDAMRAVFRRADKKMRQDLVPILPPAIVSFAGIQMYVDPRDNYTDRMIWRDGQPPEMQCLTALVELVEGRNAFVLDVGANSGAFTVPLGVAAGPGSRVIAFEPSPSMIGRLGHNVRLNDLGDVVRIEGCALGAAQGEATLHFRARNFGQASLLPMKPGKQAGGTLVPVRTLLDFVHEAAGHDISILKIDVEGAEPQVLDPLLRAADWLPDAILIETDHAENWGYDLSQHLETFGYQSRLEAEQNTLFIRSGAP